MKGVRQKVEENYQKFQNTGIKVKLTTSESFKWIMEKNCKRYKCYSMFLWNDISLNIDGSKDNTLIQKPGLSQGFNFLHTS